MQEDVQPKPLPPHTVLSPTIPEARIEALDVVRGFALLGIFLMNIEFFNRSMSGIGEGMPVGLTGMDWFASWFISYFVQGKFWTIFSLLFGMGFAVMLTRAERAQRAFLAPYLRRILGLAVFGASHYIFLWAGDILFSYAVGAGALLILLYGQWKPIVVAIAVLVGIGAATGLDPLFAIAGSLTFVSLVSLYMRDEKRILVRGHHVPRLSLIFCALGVVAVIAAIVLWSLPNGPKEPRIPASVAGVVLLVMSVLSAKFKDPVDLRPVRLGATIYLTSFVIMSFFGAVQYLTPPEPADAPASVVADKKHEPTAAEKAVEKKAEQAKRLATRLEERRNEVRILSSGRYAEAVEMRARHFPEKLAQDAGFATVLIAMFLLGSWFVRSGIMENTGAHLPLFRKLAFYGLPLGIGLGLLGSTIAVTHVPGAEHDGFQLARGLTVLGNLPACLGYVGMVVLMLHSRSVFAGIRVLAPLGRMALSNYLLQSVICSFYFYGYGLGHWGMGRAHQVVFVAVVFTAQTALSHWWLSRFRFGPMEWVWRAFTYRTMPAIRREATRPAHGIAA
jgi:uncharacterized membrane protein YeiB